VHRLDPDPATSGGPGAASVWVTRTAPDATTRIVRPQLGSGPWWRVAPEFYEMTGVLVQGDVFGAARFPPRHGGGIARLIECDEADEAMGGQLQVRGLRIA
jgi:hypothetical protein